MFVSNIKCDQNIHAKTKEKHSRGCYVFKRIDILAIILLMQNRNHVSVTSKFFQLAVKLIYVVAKRADYSIIVLRKEQSLY